MLQQILIRMLTPLSRNVSYTVKDGLAAGLKRRGGLGYLPRPTSLLTADEGFLKALDLTGKVVYDIGGYQGIYTIFFARAVGSSGRVICFEPHPDNVSAINGNIALNGFSDRAEVRHMALGDSKGRVSLVVPNGAAGMSSVEPALQEAYVTNFNKTDRLTVPMDTLDNQSGSVPAPQFLKVDVEGAEVAVLRGARETLRRHKPAVFLEMHGTSHEDKRERAVAVLAILEEAGYHVVQIATGDVLTPATPPQVGTGAHLYATPR